MAGIERVERPDPSRFRREYFRRGRPVVLVGATDHWPARRWTIEELGERLDDCRVDLAVLADDGHVRIDTERGLVSEPMDMRAYVEELRGPAPPRHYLRLRLDGPYRFLRADIEEPPYCVASLLTTASVLFGGAGTVTDTHYDMQHNLVAQLRGRRRVTLFSPDDGAHLYPYPIRSLHWHHSRVRLEAPDPIAFPRFGQARPLSVELAPGEMLFIPRGWWHHFEALDPTVAVNFFWLTPRLLPPLVVARAFWMLRRVQSSY